MLNIDFSNIIIKKYYSVLQDIINHKYTHYWFSGGRGSTKSSFISFCLPLLMLINKDAHCLVLRKISSTLKDSVFNQILWAIDILNLNQLFKINISPLEITYLPTGQKIFFRGSDDPIKIKSIKPRFGYIAVTWFEELDQFKGEEEIRNILQSANRGGSKYWNFYSFNPPKSKDNWVNIAILSERNDKLVTHNSYLDVPQEWLGMQFITEAEYLKKNKPKSYEHEYLGIAVGIGGAIFDNIETREIAEEEINTMDYFYYGIDFGFSVDPFAWVKVSFNSKKNTLYILDEIYQVQLTNNKAVQLINNKMKDVYRYVITGDSAEPRTIADFRERGISIKGAIKGPDSVNRGIKWLQDLDKIVIDKRRTPNAFREFLHYEYDMDKHGNFISNYPDKNNHTIDAIRYALEDIMNSRRIRWG